MHTQWQKWTQLTQDWKKALDKHISFTGFLFIYKYVPMHPATNSAELISNAIVTSSHVQENVSASFTRVVAVVHGKPF